VTRDSTSIAAAPCALAALLLVRSTRASRAVPLPTRRRHAGRGPLVLTAEPPAGGRRAEREAGGSWSTSGCGAWGASSARTARVDVRHEASWSRELARGGQRRCAVFLAARRAAGRALAVRRRRLFSTGDASRARLRRAPPNGQETRRFRGTTTHAVVADALVMNTPHRLCHWWRQYQRLRVSGRRSSSATRGSRVERRGSELSNSTSGRFAFPTWPPATRAPPLVLASSSVLDPPRRAAAETALAQTGSWRGRPAP
jgi:hypothetical protein